MSNSFSGTVIVFNNDGLGQADEALRHKLATNYLRTLLELGSRPQAILFYAAGAKLVADFLQVAGMHRLLPHLPQLSKARLIIAVAGMEGALPGVLAGLFPSPVLAVPSSIGYGVSEGGRAALAGMLASCAPGLAVFNIDNGFGAAAFAAKLLQPTRRIP